MKNRSFTALFVAVLMYIPLCAHAGGTPDTVHSEQLDTVWVKQYHQKTIYDVVFSPDGSLIASSSGDRTLKLVSTETGELVRSIPTAPYQGTLSFSPDGRYLASGGSSKAYIWDVSSGELVRTIEEHKNLPSAPEIVVRYSPDGRYFITSGYDKLVVWDAATGEKVSEFDDGEGWRIPTFAPDNNTIAFTWQGALLIADISTAKVRKTFAVIPLTLPSYTTDGSSIAVRYRYTDFNDNLEKTEILFLDTNDFTIRHVVEFGPAKINRYVFSPSGANIATITDDTYIDIRDVASGTLTRRYYFNGPFGPMPQYALAVSPDSSYLLTANIFHFLWNAQWQPDIVGVGEQKQPTGAVVLYPPYPLPSHDQLQLRYSLTVPVQVMMQIINLRGEVMATPVQAAQQPGEYIVLFDATTLAAGQYFCRIQAGQYIATQPFIISR